MAKRSRSGEASEASQTRRSRELRRASRRLERALEWIDLDDDRLAEAVVTAIRATDRARRLEAGGGVSAGPLPEEGGREAGESADHDRAGGGSSDRVEGAEADDPAGDR